MSSPFRSLLAVALVLTATGAAAGPAGAREERALPPSSATPVPEDVLDGTAIPWAPRRFAPCAGYDRAGGRMVVVGGRAVDGVTHHDDAWELRLPRGRQPAWDRLTGPGTPGAPPPLRSCAAAVDQEGGRLLVFGGWDGVTATQGVWALSLRGDPGWTQLCDASSCGRGPSARRSAQASWDARRGRLLVTGGLDGAYRDDLWALDLTGDPRWERLAPAGVTPEARAGHAQVLDPDRDAVWVFGGAASGAELGDLWRLDLATLRWTEVDACTGGCPAPRTGSTLVLDDAGDRLVLFGGVDTATGTYPQVTEALVGLDGAPSWTTLRPDSEVLPGRANHAAVHDARNRRMIVFGGAAGSTTKDLAALALPGGGDAPAWLGLAPRTPVNARDQVAVHLDAGRRRLFAFGGFGAGTLPGTNGGGTHLADTSRLDLARPGTWRAAAPTPAPRVPLAREAAASVSDPAGNRLFVLGGLQGDTSMADVWVAGFGSAGRPSWRQLCSPVSCGDGPPARWGAHAVHDPVGDRLVLFGGRRGGGASLGDVWTLTLGERPRWTEVVPAGPGPAPRWGGAAVLDGAGRRLVVWGGQSGTDAAAAVFDDAWALSLDGETTWTRLAPGGTPPPPRRSPAAAQDLDGSLVISGGLDPRSAAHFNDVHRLRLDTADGTWERLRASDCADPSAPACRRSAAAAVDPATGRLVVVFGRDAARLFADGAAFDPATGEWSTLGRTPP